MKSTTLIALTAGLALSLSSSLSADTFDPLRGAIPLTGDSAPVENMKVQVVQGGFQRSFEQQPPMIPHDIEKYDISLRSNGCFKCHSEETFEKEKAPRVSDSHYLDRDGNMLAKISSRRYFCTQCHTVQLSGAPLVDNTFKGR
jgi:cytochrome c-type protein NapB